MLCYGDDRSYFWPFARAFIFLMGTLIYCAASDSSRALNAQALSTAIQEAEGELDNRKALAELYVFATGGLVAYKEARTFVEGISGQIDLDRIKVEDNSAFVGSGSQPASRVQLSQEDFGLLVAILVTETGFERILRENAYSLGYVLKLLSASIDILTNPFSITPQMNLFRNNLVTALKKSKTEDISSIGNPEDIPGVTKASLRTILDIYTGTSDKLAYFAEQIYSADEQDDSLVVYNGYVLDGPKSLTVLLHLVRLCKITELNVRSSMLGKPLSQEAQDILAACQITKLVPPASEESCRNLYLTPNCDVGIQNRIWHSLAEVGWFSRRGDWIQMYSLESIFEIAEAKFLRHLVRPAIRPENFCSIELLSIFRAQSSARWVEYLKNAVNVRVLNVMHRQDTLDMDFLKNLTKLEALWLQDVAVAELPGDILAGLSSLAYLRISGTQLIKLPPEIGQLKKLKKLIITRNLSLRAIPDTLGDCPELSYLDLSSSSLRSIPSKLGSVDYLNISGNKSPELLAAATNYTNLRTLKAAANIITTLPANFGNLKNLRTLNLGFNDIFELPPVLAELPVLEELDLSGNHLSALPHSMAYLRYLHTLELDYNDFQRVPRFLGDMKERSNLSVLKLSNNPLQNDDTSDRLGLRTLWDVFEGSVMSEDEYRDRIKWNERDKRERKAFYDELRSEPVHWNLEVIQQLRLTAPPRSKLSQANLESAWTEILKDPVFGGDKPPITRKRLYKLIEVLHNPASYKLRGYKISEFNKIVMRDYMEAVTHGIQERMKRGDTDRAIAMLGQVNDSLGNCPSGQAGALMEIHRLHCLGEDPDDFRCYVGEFIAREKEDRFTAVLALLDHPQNIHLVLYWREQLGGDLGLVLEYRDPSGRQGPDQYGDSPAAVLRAFFARFSLDAVIKALVGKINKEGKVGEASKYLNERNLLPVEVRGKYFELVEGVDDAAENFYFKEVKEAGVEELLVSMGILVRGQ